MESDVPEIGKPEVAVEFRTSQNGEVEKVVTIVTKASPEEIEQLNRAINESESIKSGQYVDLPRRLRPSYLFDMPDVVMNFVSNIPDVPYIKKSIADNGEYFEGGGFISNFKDVDGVSVVFGEVAKAQEVGEMLAKAREAAGVSKSEIARRMGTGEKQVRRIEGGEHSPSAETLQKYAEAIGCEIRFSISPEGWNRELPSDFMGIIA